MLNNRYPLILAHGYLPLVLVLLGLVPRMDIEARQSVDMDTENAQRQTQSTSKHYQNPHWKNEGCGACHKDNPEKNNVKLHNSDMNALCNSCHSSISEHSYIHPYGMSPSATIMRNMPTSFSEAVKRGNGKLTCITCHDLPMTCLTEKKEERGLNPLFFRDGPYNSRTELCYHCHDKTKYQRLNPHDQVSDAGEIKNNLCTVCHISLDKLKLAKNINEVDFNYQGNLSAMCAGCHPVKPHPGGAFSFFSNKKGPNHLVRPSDGMLKYKNKMERKNNISLPLEPGTGKVFCGTCHNPHEKGVIKDIASARGADSPNRLRMKKLCTNCHDK